MKVHIMVLQKGSFGMFQTACGLRPYLYEKNNTLMASPKKIRFTWSGVPTTKRCKRCIKAFENLKEN